MADRQGEIDALVTRTIEGSPRTQWVEGGTELEFFCPVGHPDSQDPHAYWNRRKGTWYCQKCGAAGSTYELAKTLGIQLPAERKAKAQDFRIVQTYDYKDAGGNLYMQVVRMEPKDFRVRRPNPDQNGKPWIWNKSGVVPQLYRLPEVLAARDDAWILFCEGEKDVDRAIREGYPVATTNPFGAQEARKTGAPGKPKWEPQYTETLRNRNVAICLDADNAGGNSARQIGLILRPHAKRVIYLTLPGLPLVRDGQKFKDLSDWFALGNTLEDLYAVLDQAVAAPDDPMLPPDLENTEIDADDVLRFAETDAGNGELFAHLFGANARYDHQRGRWLVWKGDHWGADADGQLTRWAIEQARFRAKASSEIDNRASALKSFAWAKSSESAGRIKSTLDLARNQPPIADPGKGWDTTPLLLGVSNGVVNLTSGELRRGRQDDRITMSTDVGYDTAAECPRWLQFISEIFDGDQAMIEYVHRAVGYSLTGSTREQVWFICHGKGANGKSTFLEVLQRAFGDYAGNLPFTALMKGKEQSIPTDLAALPGKRLITASETQENSTLNEARIKALTGGDTITARQLYERQFSFVPELKLWVALNHLPNVTDSSEGFWRRVRVISFNRQFGAADRDDMLKEKLYQELPGILKWAIAGASSWHKKGLKAPTQVMMPTLAYQAESDPLDDFIRDCCVVTANAHVGAGALYTAYVGWADRQGYRDKDRMSNSIFGKRMVDRFTRRHSMNGKTFYGIGIRSEDEIPENFSASAKPSYMTAFKSDLADFTKSGRDDLPLREVSQKSGQSRHAVMAACLCVGRHGDDENPCPEALWWVEMETGMYHCTLCHPAPVTQEVDTNE